MNTSFSSFARLTCLFVFAAAILAIFAKAHPAVAGVTAQGVSLQGVTAQGVTAQGVTAQGVTAQGVTAQGVTAQGPSVQHVTARPLTRCTTAEYPVRVSKISQRPIYVITIIYWQ